MSSPVYDLADHYVERFAALDPLAATGEGIGGHDHEMTDFSPDGAAERAELDRATLARSTPRSCRPTPTASPPRGCANGSSSRSPSTSRRAPPRPARARQPGADRAHGVRPHGEGDGRRLAGDRRAHGARAPGSSSIEAALAEGAAEGVVAARRQAVACTKQADTWGGLDAATRPFFHALRRRVRRVRARRRRARGRGSSRWPRARRRRTRRSVASSCEEYAPRADERDPVGTRALLALRAGLQRHRARPRRDLRVGMGRAAPHRARHGPGRRAHHPRRRRRHRDRAPRARPARAIEGVDAFQRWNQDLLDTTVAELNGTHFDIPAPVQRVEAMIAPPGGAAAMYYTGPAEDFSRPGRTWYPTLGKTRFPLWGEVSICYHEGVPGHHLQIGQVRYLADTLSRFQRTLAGTSGHAEGWALYAERLMGELGYLDDPAYELGMLARAGDARGARRRRHRDAPRAADPGARALPAG